MPEPEFEPELGPTFAIRAPIIAVGAQISSNGWGATKSKSHVFVCEPPESRKGDGLNKILWTDV